MSHSPKEREFVALNIAVLTVSENRTEETDKSGKLLADRLQAAGHSLAEKKIVPEPRVPLIGGSSQGWSVWLATTGSAPERHRPCSPDRRSTAQRCGHSSQRLSKRQARPARRASSPL